MQNNWPWKTKITTEDYDSNIIWPKISIVTPSFNQGNFIEETILSILNQKYPNLEYIIIDGASSDNTLKIIEKYKSQLHYFISEKDNGQSDALVKGFSKATGQILNWINSDDILNEYALLNVANAFLNNKIDFMHSRNAIIDMQSNLIGYMPNYIDNLKLRYLYEMPHGQQSAFFSTEIYNKVSGINPNLSFSMDYELYVKMHMLNCVSMRFDFLCGSIRSHDNTKTNTLKDIMYIENGIIFSSVLENLGYYKESKFLKELGYNSYDLNIKSTIKIKKSEIKSMVAEFYKKILWNYYNCKSPVTKNLIVRIFKNKPSEIFNLNNLKVLKDSIFFNGIN